MPGRGFLTQDARGSSKAKQLEYLPVGSDSVTRDSIEGNLKVLFIVLLSTVLLHLFAHHIIHFFVVDFALYQISNRASFHYYILWHCIKDIICSKALCLCNSCFEAIHILFVCLFVHYTDDTFIHSINIFTIII